MKKLIGTKEFYKAALIIALPIMIQNGLTSFVNLLDNLMVGTLGTESMTGVSIANQLLFVYQLTVFGGVSGAGIFTAQYYGKGDDEGIRYTMRFKLIVTVLLATVAAILFLTAGDRLIDLFLYADNVNNVDLCRSEALRYLRIMILTTFPFALTQVYGDTLRSCGHTTVPMYAGTAAILHSDIRQAGSPRSGRCGRCNRHTDGSYHRMRHYDWMDTPPRQKIYLHHRCMAQPAYPHTADQTDCRKGYALADK